MKNHIQIKINIGFQDYVALALAIISFITVRFLFFNNFYIYIIGLTLLLSIFLEKKVQILLIANSLVFLFTYQFLPLNVSNLSIIDFLSLNFSKSTENSFIIFFGLTSFSVIVFITISSNLILVLDSKNQQYLDYFNTFSSVGFIIIALTISFVLVQENSVSVLSSLPSIAINFFFFITTYLYFTLIINFYYIFFALVFLCFFIIRKLNSMLTPSQKQTQKEGAKRNQVKKEKEVKKVKKSKSQKVRGV